MRVFVCVHVCVCVRARARLYVYVRVRAACACLRVCVHACVGSGEVFTFWHFVYCNVPVPWSLLPVRACSTWDFGLSSHPKH